MDLKKRIQRIYHHIPNGIDAILIKNGSDGFIDKNFFYVTNINQGLFEGCALILFPDGSAHLLVTSLEQEIAHKTTENVHIFKDRKELLEKISDILDSSKKIGINSSSLLYTDYLFLSSHMDYKSFIDVSKGFIITRMVKDASEIATIRKACKIADKVAEIIPQFIKKNMYEFELAAEIDYHLQRFGAKKPSFETISSFGSNTAMPHYSHGNKRLEKGDFILCDFGATVDNYHSDTTRTFIFGSGSQRQKEIYETVKNAQLLAFKMIKPGIIANSVHQKTFEFIQQSQFKDRFIHSTGHSLGLNVHDPGVGFNVLCQETLNENMVLTVEPGIYLPEFGGVRIEDDILVTKSGCELLTQSTSDFMEI